MAWAQVPVLVQVLVLVLATVPETGLGQAMVPVQAPV
jgi:hypothetical protein